MSTRHHVLAILAALALVVLAACGSDDSKPEPSTTTRLAVSPPRQSVMRAGLITKAVLPEGWVDNGPTEDTAALDTAEAQKVASAIPECADFVDASGDAKALPRVKSHTFSETSSATAASTPNEIANQVSGYPTPSAASKAFAVWSDSQTPVCLRNLFDVLIARNLDHSRPEGADLPKVEVTAEKVTATRAGDENVAYQLPVTATTQRQTQQFLFTLEVVRSGQYLLSYNAALYQAPTSDKLGAQIVTATVNNLAAADMS